MPRTYCTKPARLLKRTSNHLRLDLGDDGELRQLGQSYLARPLHPVIADAATLEIYDGNRRIPGVMLIDPDAEVPCCLIDEPWNDSVKLEIQMESAAHTKGLTDYEQYAGCSQWLTLNPASTAKELAGRIHRNEAVLCKLLSLSKCTQEVKDAAKAGLIGYSKWHPISKLPPGEQPAMLAAALKGATRDQLQGESRRQRNGNGHATPAVRLPRIKIPLATDTATGTVTLAGDEIDLDDAETLLREATKAVKAAREKNLDAKTAQAVWRDMAKAGGA
jgi:hypothetical protein